MEVVPPHWSFTTACPCGVCGGSYPDLMACPRCGHVVTSCVEIPDTFFQPRRGRALAVIERPNCPNCHSAALADVVAATDSQIQACGLESGTMNEHKPLHLGTGPCSRVPVALGAIVGTRVPQANRR